MVKETFEVGNFKCKIAPSAYTLVVYQKVTGNDLLMDFQEMESSKKLDSTMFLNFLFSLAFCADENIEYTNFMQKAPMSLIANKLFMEKLAVIIKENFNITDDVKKSTSTKK